MHPLFPITAVSHYQHVGEIALLVTVPKRIAQAVVVLHGDRVNGVRHLDCPYTHVCKVELSDYLKAALLEQHHRRVVDARALREDEDRQLRRVVHVLF